MKFFRFEKKIGWSEVIASFSLFFALAAFYYSYTSTKSQVTVENVPIGVGEVSDTSFGILVPVVLSNRGGRAVTVVSMGKSPELPMIFISADGKVASAPLSSYRIFLVRQPLSDINLQSWYFAAGIGTPFENVDLLVGTTLPPGESRTFVLGIRIEKSVFSNTKEKKVLFAFDAHFSDGQNIPIRGMSQLAP